MSFFFFPTLSIENQREDCVFEFVKLVDGFNSIVRNHARNNSPLKMDHIEFIMEAIKYRTRAIKYQGRQDLTDQEKTEFEIAKKLTKDALHLMYSP